MIGTIGAGAVNVGGAVVVLAALLAWAKLKKPKDGGDDKPKDQLPDARP